MTTGYIAPAGDLDALFMARASTKIADVGFKSNGGVDISNRFEPRGSSTARANTGFVSGASDLSTLFRDINAYTVDITDVTYSATASSAPVAGYGILTDGNVRRVQNGSLTTPATWITPTFAAPGVFRARATQVSGAPLGGSALATYIAVSSSPVWTLTKAGSVSGTIQAVITVDIDNGAGVILDTATITLQAIIP
jgi:hypothetical protein